MIELLNKDELKGVIGHEMSHILHNDILIQTIAATIAGAISFIASMARFSLFFGGYSRDNDNNNLFQLLILAILVPIIELIIQLAISRSREYYADYGSAKLTKDPLSLANALEKLERFSKQYPMEFGNSSTAHLFIVNPFKRDLLTNLLSTHPPTKERIKRLKELANKQL